MAVGRRDEARPRKVIKARLHTNRDDHAGAGGVGGARDRAREGIANELQEPAAPFEDLHNCREARGVQIVEACQQGRGAPDKQATLGGPAQDLNGLQYRAYGERVVVGEKAPRGHELQVRSDRTATEKSVEGCQYLAQLLILNVKG